MFINKTLRTIIIPVIMTITVLVMILLGWSMQRLVVTLDQSEISQDVMIAAEIIKYTLVDAETGERGYIITGDKRYLEPYDNALNVIENQLLDLKLKMNLKTAEDSSVYSIGVLAHNKLGQLAKGIELRDTVGFDAARDSLLTNVGKQEMDDVRSIVQNIQEVEERRAVASTSIIKGMVRVILCCTLMFLVCISCLFIAWFGNPLKATILKTAL